MGDPRIIVDITGDASGLGAAVTGATSQVKGLTKAVSAMGLMQVGNQFSAMGGKITQTTDKMMGSFMGLETAWAKVQTMMGTSGDAAKEFGADIDRLGETIPVQGGKVEILAGLYQTLSAGFDKASGASQVLETSMKLAKGGATDTFTAVDALTTILNSYGLGAEKATWASDIMFQTYKMGKITIEELAGGIGEVTAIAAQLDVEFEEISAAIATLTANGINSDKAITGLNATMSAFLKPSEDMKDTVQALGYQSAFMMIKTEGLAGSLQLLTEHTGGSADQMTKLFPNIRALKDVLPLTGVAAEDFQIKLDAMSDSAGNTNEAFSIMADTTSAKMELLNTRMIDAEAAFGAMMAPTQVWVDEMKVGLLETLTEINPELGDMVASTVVLSGEMMNSVGPIISMMGSMALLSSTLGITKKQMLGMGYAMGTFMLIMIALQTDNKALKAVLLGLAGAMIAYKIATWAATAAHIAFISATTLGIMTAAVVGGVILGLTLLWAEEEKANKKANDEYEKTQEILDDIQSGKDVDMGALGSGTVGTEYTEPKTGAGESRTPNWYTLKHKDTGQVQTFDRRNWRGGDFDAQLDKYRLEGWDVIDMGFQKGGVVPGPAGAPMSATVHGKEMILTPEQQRSISGDNISITNHFNIQSNDPNEVAKQIQRIMRRQTSRTYRH